MADDRVDAETAGSGADRDAAAAPRPEPDATASRSEATAPTAESDASAPRPDLESAADGSARTTADCSPPPTSAAKRPLDDLLPLDWKDVATGAVLGAVLAVGPLTPQEWLPSLAVGACAAVAWVVYRSRHRNALPEVEGEPETSRGAASWGALSEIAGTPLTLAAAGLYVLAFAPTLAWMYREWTTSVWQNNHGMFIPVVMFFLARSALRRDARVCSEPDRPSAWGLAWLVLALALAALDSAANTAYLAGIGFVVGLPGLSLLLLGVRRTRALRVAFVMGVFMIPIPTLAANHVWLRNITAAASAPVLDLLGLPTLREHTVLTLPDNVFIVGDACSGFATLYSSVAIVTFLSFYCRPSRRALLLLSFLPLALAANVVRVAGLVLMAELGSVSLLDTALHEASGVAAFFLVLVVLFALADRAALREAVG